MGRGLSTLVLVVILAALGAYIYFVDSERPGGVPGPAGTIVESKEKVFKVDAESIQELRVTAEKESALLRKNEGTWQMVEPTQAAVDDFEVSGLTNNLTGLEYGRIVEENAADLSTYGLADPRFIVAYKTTSGDSGEIHIGERTATGSDLYAVKAGEKRVFLIPSYHESSFNKKPFDLRDKRVVHVKREDIDSVQVSGAVEINAARSNNEWRLTAPLEARADYSAVEGLVSRVANANMATLVEEAPSGSLAADVLAKYGLDKPSVTVTVGAGSAKATLALGKEENGAIYARDLSRPLVFTVDSTLLTDLKKPVDDYRDKDAFEFRPYNLDRIRIVRGSDAYEFTKVTQANEPDKWQRTINGGAPADVDTSKVDDLLSKLSNLRIESFVTSAPRDVEITVSASYAEGKFERVRFGKSGSDVIVAREGEPGGGRVDATNYQDTIKALDEAIAAGPPTTEEK
jgi:hypothetical protein